MTYNTSSEMARKDNILLSVEKLECKIELLRKDMKMYNIILLSVIIFTHQDSLRLIAKLLGLIK